MAKPLTRNQRLENAAFLKALRRSGNIRLAARETGVAYGTIQHRRKAHPIFAQGMAAAQAFAHAALHERGGEQRPTATATASHALHGAAEATPRPATTSPKADPHRTCGGEAVVIRRKDGRLQLRRAQPGKLTKACEQAFLAALSATANVKLAAAAAGAAEAAFYQRRRRHPGFAREMRLALECGYEALEAALLETTAPTSHEDDAWRHNAPPAIPPMTVDEALHLLRLHQKEVRLGGTPEALRRRPGESREAMTMRLALMHEARMERDREAFRVAEAARAAARDPVSRHEPPPPLLPDLAQVRARSRSR